MRSSIPAPSTFAHRVCLLSLASLLRVLRALVVRFIPSSIMLAAIAATHAAEPDRFAGNPAIGQHRPGERTLKTITSDAVTGLVRPKWTRAMTDLGAWPVMVRFKQDILLTFYHGDGHRGKQHEATGELWTYRSGDDGRTWQFTERRQLRLQAAVSISFPRWMVAPKCRRGGEAHHGRQLGKGGAEAPVHVALISRANVEELDDVADRRRVELGKLVKNFG